MSTHSNAQNTSGAQQRRHRNPPSFAAVCLADTTLIAISELQAQGLLDPVATKAGMQFSRKDTEQLIMSVGHRAREILMTRHTPHFLNTPYGKQLVEAWMNVPLREVVYALSTAHFNCLRAFRVFFGKTVEWVGDDSHRATPEDAGVPEEKSTSTDDIGAPDGRTVTRRTTGEEGEGRGY